MENQKTNIDFASNALQQYRQLSIPLWTRIVVVVLVSVVFVANLVFLGFALVQQQEKWLTAAVAIFGTTFLPTVVILYVAFAETGTKALGKKTTDLLLKIVPDCLAQLEIPGVPEDETAVGTVRVHTPPLAVAGPTCKYRVDVLRQPGNEDRVVEQLRFLVDINVSKVNVLLLLPCERLSGAGGGDVFGEIQAHLPHTIDGARREGYEFNPHAKPVQIDGVRYVGLAATKRLASDFLWDPAKKLYFAQDLALFIGSALAEGRRFFTPAP